MPLNADDPTPFRPPEETPTVVVDDTAADAGHFAPGTVLGGRYRIVSLVGRGGMGAVYRGDDLRIGQPIAMKFLRRTSGARERMLYDEVRIGRQVSHPNVCRLYDIADVDGQIFITMEFVDGEDLASLLRRIGRLPHDKALSVARDLCAGLAAAHEMGVIHRDLKPGNIMIDGRGRARITDFGLAVADTAREGGTAGTPAYMAPEQLVGSHATVQSDIYALGLVLYELFTGRRVHSAGSVAEIVAQRSSGTVTRPAELVKDIDPAVERAILHCLDADPARRPQSVPEITRELPSFDALDAAVAAGDIPSPAMVAAATERGDLRAGTAWALLAVSLAATAGIAFLAERMLRVNAIGEIKPPAVMLEQVRELLTATRLQAPARDTAWMFLPTELGGGEHPVQFVYRQSPRPMESGRFDRILTASDPPHTISGMATVRLDPSGRLVELIIVPPQREAAPPPREPDFSMMFEKAGVNRASLVPATPEWAAPVDTDVKRAWTVSGTDRRIEAAGYHGRPVWFATITPRTMPGRMTEREPPRAERITRGTMIPLLLLLPVLTVLLAVRNLRRGQGDRRGATRVAIYMFVTLALAGVIRLHHVPDYLQEWWIVSAMLVDVTFWTLAFWMAYVAVEPLIRRRWPRILISWSRLLEGRWGDAMVGRDVLIGISFACVAAVTLCATYLIGNERMPSNITPLGSIRHTLFTLLLNASGQSVGRALFGAVLILALRAIFRKMSVVLVVAVLLSAMGVANMPGGPVALRITWAVLVSIAVWTLLLRVGILAVTVAGFALLTLTQMPITGNPSSWYFGTSMLTLVPIVALALFGFWTSLGGKSPFPELALER